MASIQKRDGKYRVRFRDPIGGERSRTFHRKVDAERFAREIEVDKDRGSWIDPRKSDTPLRDWVQTFLASSIDLAPTTIQTYRRDLEQYVLPALGARRLAQLHAEEIQAWITAELAGGVAPSSVHRHYRTLRRVLQTAVESDRLLKNPCDRVRPPKVTTRPMAILTWNQSVALAEAHPERLKAMIYLALDSGMRWSELTGLRRSQLDLARRKVRVTEQLIQLDDKSRVRRPPKTSAGVRSITISASTAAMLERHLEQFIADDADALVFTTGVGTPLSHSSFQSHFWKKALTAAGVRCRFHDLRHTSVALAIASGAHRRRSKRGWVTARSPSPSTATATCSPSSTKPSPTPSTSAGPRRERPPGWCDDGPTAAPPAMGELSGAECAAAAKALRRPNPPPVSTSCLGLVRQRLGARPNGVRRV